MKYNIIFFIMKYHAFTWILPLFENQTELNKYKKV